MTWSTARLSTIGAIISSGAPRLPSIGVADKTTSAPKSAPDDRIAAAPTDVHPGFNLFTPQQDVELGRQSAAQVEHQIPLIRTPRTLPRVLSPADVVYAQDSQSTLARWYGAALTTGGTVEQVQSWSDRIRAVDAAAVQAAAKQWLDKRRSVTGYLIKDTRPTESRS